MSRRNLRTLPWTSCVIVFGCIAMLSSLACDRRGLRKPLDAEAPSATAPSRSASGIQFTFENHEAQSIHLAGSFNNWSTTTDPMENDGTGTWRITKALAPGEHQYKFVVNGGQSWEADPLNSNQIDDGFGGGNSVIEVLANGSPASVEIKIKTKTPVAKVAPVEQEGAGPVKVEAGWKFTLDMPSANTVHLAGTFNSWSTSADPLTKNADGVWVVEKSLAPGTHQYKFTINGGESWNADPSNPNTSDDGFGGNNSVLVVQ